MSTTRREVIAAVGVIAAAGLVASAASAAPKMVEIKPKPLAFDPKKLTGLSERLLVSHWENNYGGAVKNLNKVRSELASVTADTPSFIVGGLKERELTFSNSRVLHEAYFDCLGAPSKPAGAVSRAIADAFGDFTRFETLFRATALSLSGGSGWVILALDLNNGELNLAWSGHHTQNASGAFPILVCDMYEHAYHIDYGAAAARYFDAFWANIAWETVNKHYEKAVRAWKA